MTINPSTSGPQSSPTLQKLLTGSRNLEWAIAMGMILSLLSAGSWADAADLYVSAEKGAEGNDGSAEKPFKTIQEAARVANAGDTVHIHAGTYRETVTPARSGTKDQPITFKACDGESVTISGADPITGWTLFNGNIHVADMKGDFFSAAQPGTGEQAKLYDAKVHNQADQVFCKGQMMFVARWPNTPSLDVSQPVKAITEMFVSKTRSVDKWTTGSVTDNDIANSSRIANYSGTESSDAIPVCLKVR